MDMPRPTAEHTRLAAMAGDWQGDETMHPSPWDPKGGKAVSHTTARVAMDGFFVVAEYEQRRGETVTYRGHGVFGWDARQRCYTMYWFDSMSGQPEAPTRGVWEGSALLFQHQHAMGHTRYTYDFIEKDKYLSKLEFSRDGQSWTPFVEGVYTRR